jgi:protein-disulfide isomerase
MFRLLVCTFLLVGLAPPAFSDEGYYPIRADDGAIIANHPVAAESERKIEKLPGAVVVGNPQGTITLTEFYDVNCSYCRKASADIDELLKTKPHLRLILVPFPVLGIPSIQGTRVELAVVKLASANKFYEFHRLLDTGRGVVDGNRALAAAKAVGLDVDQVLRMANERSLGDIMTAHVKLGDEFAIQATPGFVVKDVAIVGYPGPNAMAKILDSVEHCGAVVCSDGRQ